jgi:Tfp pilus assembly protein PilV
MTKRMRRRLNEKGISVIELLVGITLLAVVVVSLAAASLYASRTMTRSRMELEAVEFQQSELERLLAVPYDDLASDARTTEYGQSSWTVADSFTYRRIILVTNYTPVEGLSVWDTVVAYRLR